METTNMHKGGKPTKNPCIFLYPPQIPPELVLFLKISQSTPKREIEDELAIEGKRSILVNNPQIRKKRIF